MGKSERGKQRGRRSLFHIRGRESLQGQKAQESKRSRPWLNTGGRKGARLFGWEETVGAPGQGRWVLPGSAGAEEGLGRVSRSPGRRKALKSEAQERWGLKEASKGL